MRKKIDGEPQKGQEMEKSGIIFDMDGTLWDSAKAVADSWTEVVAREYTPERVITEEEIKSVMGLTMDKLAARIFPELPEEKRLQLLEVCGREENEYLRTHGAIVYPQVEETFQKLKEKYHLYIVSNCQSGYIEAFLEYYGYGKYRCVSVKDSWIRAIYHCFIRSDISVLHQQLSDETQETGNRSVSRAGNGETAYSDGYCI